LKIKAIARVQVTVEVEVSAWGGDCQIGQLFEQAKREGLDKVRSLASKNSMTVVGEPKVIGVITQDER
jgi:hypothetical protein